MTDSLVSELKSSEAQDVNDGISDDAVYALNPFFRFRNEKTYVYVYGWLGTANQRIHHTEAIILLLCDGSRTIREIAEFVTPFVSKSFEGDVFAEALGKVKAVATRFTKSQAELRGQGKVHSELPAEACLIEPALLPQFKRVPRVEYDPTLFMPEYALSRTDQCCEVYRERTPLQLQWHLTSTCCTDCRYCYLGRRQISPMPKERLFELIQEAHDIGVLDVSIAGGDVLLYPHLLEVLHVLDELKFMPVQMATKAPVSKEMAKSLSECGNVWELQFSVDSLVPEVADFLVRRPGFAKSTLQSIENALEAGLHVTAKAVVTPYNIATIPSLYRQLRNMGVSTVRMASYCRSGYHHTDDLFNTEEGFVWLQGELDKIRDEFPDDLVNVQNGGPQGGPVGKEALEKMWSKRNRCTAGRSMMCICSDGKVIPCEQMPESEEVFIGDVMKQSIQEVWDGKALKELTVSIPREKFKGTVCYDCEERNQCHNLMGYCIRDACVLYGTPYVPAMNCPKAELPFIRQH